MEPLIRIEGRAVPLPRANVDTDTIIRIEHLMDADPANLREHAFATLRRRADGTPDPACPFNQDTYRDAPILITGANFGCGSSREHAVWALRAIGIRCVFAAGFGDIFRNNCFQNGVLAITLPAAEIARLFVEATPHGDFQVDLAACRVSTPSGREFAFEVDAWRRQRLLQGLDDLAYLLTMAPEIARWQAEDRVRRPWVWAVSAGPGAEAAVEGACRVPENNP
ncbi:MAG: 3-isopropylmalate dehydratase small subunit [Gammaproteobacteria bacterium]